MLNPPTPTLYSQTLKEPFYFLQTLHP